VNYLQLFSFLFISFLLPISQGESCDNIDNCLNKLYFKKQFIKLYSNSSIDNQNNNVRTAVIVIHGTLRNGDDYFRSMHEVSKLYNKEAETLVIAPSFKRVDDNREKQELFWGRKWYQKWKYGYNSHNTTPISSFEVIDEIIKKLSNKLSFANLRKIILIGHSAGGQFVQRYAVGRKIDNSINQNIIYVPSNPSSYLYISSDRYSFLTDDFNTINNPSHECNKYNDYIYGLNSLPSYFQKISVKVLQRNFLKRKVVYLMGEEDNKTDYLDRSCEANLQGKDRFERSVNFFQYLRNEFPPSNHQFLSVPQVGHDHDLIFKSKEAARLIFDLGEDYPFIHNKIGNTFNIDTVPSQNFLLMGGGNNESQGFIQFLKSLNGGDLLIISAKSKINHRYTHYLWRLSKNHNISINSINTISLQNKSQASHPFLIKKINEAEGVFFTGGNQFKYWNYLKNSRTLNLINKKITNGISIAGTSAGLAIMGKYIFTAQNGTITSKEALSNPLHNRITIESSFFNIDSMKNIITDSHFSERNREGRLITFMARAQARSRNNNLFGIGIDEKTSLSIFSNKIISYGSGNTFLYYSNMIPDIDNRPLNFSSLYRLKLNNKLSYPLFNQINYLKGDQLRVSNGEIKVITP
jgi:cyanophycinase